jgi:hypothetical protein
VCRSHYVNTPVKITHVERFSAVTRDDSKIQKITSGSLKPTMDIFTSSGKKLSSFLVRVLVSDSALRSKQIMHNIAQLNPLFFVE